MPDQNNPYSGYNAMQANLGMAPQQSQVPLPNQAAQLLVSQADQQRNYAMAAGLPPGAGQSFGQSNITAFGEQYRQQFEAIQAQQSFNPLVAQALGGGAGYAPGYLPSPVMMTPPSTGVYRQRTQAPRMLPMSPQPLQPMFQTPFTPQPPPAMFQLEADREARMQDLEGDRFFSRAAQAPRVVGQGIGVGAAAALGGAIGGPLGAIGGGILGGVSGLAGGVGNLAMRPFQPMVEQRRMGAALRRMSQDWVVGGPQLHETGRGFTREASVDLAEQLQELSESSSFRRETGGMFNRADLMRITQESGRAGLLDERQDIDQVRDRVKNVSRVLREYMKLTQDPDMVSVLRELGQMRQFGMTLQDMEEAGQALSRYSRAAGTSIEGMKQASQLGAATFQQAGLTPGSGMTYGMHAAAAARQAVATGAFEPRELALMGGVQGMTQRNIQAQAALMSMPLMGASLSQFGEQGFGLNQGALQGLGRGGAQGMVRGAISAMGTAVRQGGVGALATFPLQQRQIQTQAAEQMTPEEMTAGRFRTALATGQRLGLEGSGAFSLGARLSFGDEVAEQMMLEAQHPEIWQAQRERIHEQRQRLIREQRTKELGAAPGMGERMGGAFLRTTGIGRAIGEVRAGGRVVGGMFGQVGERLGGIGEFIEDVQAEREGRVVTRTPGRALIRSPEEREAVYGGTPEGVLARYGFQSQGAFQGGIGGRTAFAALDYAQASQRGGAPIGMGAAVEIGSWAAENVGLFGIPGLLGLEGVHEAGVQAAMGGMATSAIGQQRMERIVQGQIAQSTRFRRMARSASRKAGTEPGREAARKALDRAAKGKVATGGVILKTAGKIANMVRTGQSSIHRWLDEDLRQDDVERAFREALSESGMSERDIKTTLNNLKAEGGMEQVMGMAWRHAKNLAGPEHAYQFSEAEAEAGGFAKRSIAAQQEDIMKQMEGRVTLMEDMLDLSYGGIGMGFAEKEGAEEVREILTKGPGEALAAVAVAAGGEGGAYEDAFAKYKEVYGEGRDDEEVREEFGRLVGRVTEESAEWGEGVKERLRGIAEGGEGGTRGQALDVLVRGAAATQQLKQYGGVVGGGLATISKAATTGAATRLSSMAATGKITGKGIAESFTEKDIRKLHRAGYGGVAGKLAQWQEAGSEEERRKIEQELMEQVGQLGKVKEKEEEEARDTAGTEEEAKLGRSEEALAELQSEMAETFKTFKPAAEDFAKGTAKLQEAMESDMFKRIIEGE